MAWKLAVYTQAGPNATTIISGGVQFPTDVYSSQQHAAAAATVMGNLALRNNTRLVKVDVVPFEVL